MEAETTTRIIIGGRLLNLTSLQVAKILGRTLKGILLITEIVWTAIAELSFSDITFHFLDPPLGSRKYWKVTNWNDLKGR